jgi:hypothetical protein
VYLSEKPGALLLGLSGGLGLCGSRRRRGARGEHGGRGRAGLLRGGWTGRSWTGRSWTGGGASGPALARHGDVYWIFGDDVLWATVDEDCKGAIGVRQDWSSQPRVKNSDFRGVTRHPTTYTL